MKILVVEDEPTIAEDIRSSLTEAGYIVETCDSGEDALLLGSTETYSAVILDLGLPKLDGLSVLRRWRADGRAMPVVVLTARASWVERVEGINAGADDYLPKPFQMPELLARLGAVLRRGNLQRTSTITAGSLRLDTAQMNVTVAGRNVHVTPFEFRLLSHLVHHLGKVVSREELKEHVYGHNDGRDVNAIEAMIARLRRKLGIDIIETRRGQGYIVSTQS
ncbi:response regulator transcription factor [Hyphomicrobium facile]|uniref:DNA-binding response regulator, OmpR family, contains REC and winged-helix (WHTH) domain n=1 Tax=Hyphomicrobium facile TaxID=51670 RepID=A0A1I7NQV2_9HYPH|nr:response regulator transcription factor [Hyphomicrobium facile]SFV37003.1 DNA-binding response regulator, OmpR family, contains REC and winged-helix (wHTH) domain [Hyphomicrobium facile]